MEKRCFVCMNPIHSAVCSHCGHNNSELPEHGENLLRPGVTVGTRYFIGVPLDRNGEGVTYIAFDETEQVRVRVREFFPGMLCHREEDGSVQVNHGKEIQFKTLMTDFVELSKQLKGITANNNLLRARDILADNGTIYVVYEDVRGVSLPKFLRDNGGSLSWEETENLFLPLLYTVKLLNSQRIVHRGVSPENILVTEQRELKLKGVCISAVRAINSEVKPELFDGYAAPEQYEKCTSHGEWTDVYAVCALLYRVLTGVTPPCADSREGADSLRDPIELNPLVPHTVSNAIMKGMSLERSVRTRSIKDLIGDLYASAPAKTMPPPRHITDEEDEEEYEMPRKRAVSRPSSPPPSKKKKKRRVPIWLIVILITLPLMLCIFFVTYYYVLGDGATGPTASDLSSVTSMLPSSEPSSAPLPSEPPVSKAPQVLVDAFEGKDYQDLLDSESYKETFVFTAEEKFDDFVPAGEVISQSVESGTAVDKGTEIKLVVSKGMQRVTIPPLIGSDGARISVEDYTKYLVEQGIEVQTEQIETFDYEPGEIVRTSPDAGETLDRSQSNVVTLYIAAALPE